MVLFFNGTRLLAAGCNNIGCSRVAVWVNVAMSSYFVLLLCGAGHAEIVPDECQSEVYNYYIVRGKNINANVPLGKLRTKGGVVVCI
jgi:hypothetical protein